MFIILLSPDSKDSGALVPFISELRKSYTVLVAVNAHENPAQIQQLFSATGLIGTDIPNVAAAAPELAAPTRAPANGAGLCLDEKPHAPINGAAHLNMRQFEILAHVADGKTNKMIARLTGVSVDTIRGDLKKIFRVLGVKNRTTAALVQHAHKANGNGKHF